jgi:pimeloyl-ACP methyl ester carboxylesterase
MVAIFALMGGIAIAQDFAGAWRGSLKSGTLEVPIAINIAKSGDGGWKATSDIGQGIAVATANSATVEGSSLKLVFDGTRTVYEGRLSGDGISITGTWTTEHPLPLDFKRTTTTSTDSTPHNIQFVTVEPGVQLEVLDWGGSGRPLVLLAGMGNNAHVYDKFAGKLIGQYHVYGITRRGYGASSAPAPTSANYAADRLGDDVLAVVDALKLDRPVLAGHSLGGEELSSVGSRHPEKVAGLIYLDAGYPYAYYDPSHGDLLIEWNEFRRRLQSLGPFMSRRDSIALIREALERDLPAFEKDLRRSLTKMEAEPAQPQDLMQPPTLPARDLAIFAGTQKYTQIPVPILAIYALPHYRAIKDPVALARAEQSDMTTTGAQADAFEAALPSARVVRLPHADHYVFRSNESDVLREMTAFMSSLK